MNSFLSFKKHKKLLILNQKTLRLEPTKNEKKVKGQRWSWWWWNSQFNQTDFCFFFFETFFRTQFFPLVYVYRLKIRPKAPPIFRLAVQDKPQNRPHDPHSIKKYHNNDDGIGSETFCIEQKFSLPFVWLNDGKMLIFESPNRHNTTWPMNCLGWESVFSISFR